MSLAEFLEWDDGTDTRQLIDGRPRTTAPLVEADGTIAANLARRSAHASSLPVVSS